MFGFISVFALSAGVIANPFQYKLGRVHVLVRHQGAPISYAIQVRTKDNKASEWTYIDNLKYFPRKPMTTASGRKVTLEIPQGLKKYTQVCAVHTPSSGSGSSMKVVYSIQSCANLKNPSGSL